MEGVLFNAAQFKRHLLSRLGDKESLASRGGIASQVIEKPLALQRSGTLLTSSETQEGTPLCLKPLATCPGQHLPTCPGG